MSTSWGREVTVQIDELLFNYRDCDIEFKIEKSNGSNQNRGEITLWNLGNTDLDALAIDAPVRIKAGYNNDYGVIFEGTLIQTESNPSGADLATIISCADISLLLYRSEKFPLSVSAGRELSTVATEVFNMCSVPVGQIDATEYTFSQARTFVGTGQEILEELLKLVDEEEYVAYTEGGMGYFVRANNKTVEVFEINSSTGLLSAEKFGDSASKSSAKITTLLNWKIRIDAWVRIKSPNINGLYKVSKYTHSLKGETYETEIEVAAA